MQIKLLVMDELKFFLNRCHHGPQGKCINCIPLEPYDLEYLNTRNPPVKYMSFHAYIKKLQSGADK